LDVCLAKGKPRRATIHYYAHAAAVGFSPSADAKKLTELAGHK
jgi:hypothetical protein